MVCLLTVISWHVNADQLFLMDVNSDLRFRVTRSKHWIPKAWCLNGLHLADIVFLLNTAALLPGFAEPEWETQGLAYARYEMTTELSSQFQNYFRGLLNAQISSQRYAFVQKYWLQPCNQAQLKQRWYSVQDNGSSSLGYLVVMASPWQWGRKLLSTITQREEIWELLFMVPCPLLKRVRRFPRRIFFHTNLTTSTAQVEHTAFCVMHKVFEFRSPGYLRWLSSYKWVQYSYWGPEFCSQHLCLGATHNQI